ncbi:MAG: hypothetical protein AAGB35_10195 [Pseudomonadota bacterium]
MAYLTGQIAAYYAIGAGVLGLLVGWFIYQNKCNKIAAALESEKQELQAQNDAQASTIREQQYQLDAAYRNVLNLRSELALAEGNAALNHSRWQSALKQARQAPNQLTWIKSLQAKLASTRVQLQQNRQYADAMAQEARNNRDNLTRVHTRLTEVDAKIAGLKEWIKVFQTKLVKTKTEYGQLRNYANAVAASDRANHSNLMRVHSRLSEIEHKQQPLRTWIRVFQTKLMKTKSEYEQLRSYSENIQADLDAKEDNLTRTHTRLTQITNELEALKDRRNNPLPPIPPAADVSDNKALRLVDRIRLLGTSKNEVYGRMHNQIREAKLETIETERVLTDSCEEKDAIIDDLRGQIHKLENKLQTAPVVNLDQSVQIKELEAEVGQLKAEQSAATELEGMLREHKFTIEAYRSKLDSANQQLASFPKPEAAAPEEKEKPAANKREVKKEKRTADTKDNLKEIKGIGPKIEAMLNEHGITQFEHIAAWKKSDIEAISAKLGNFKDRITRDEWVKKAKKLVKKK